MKFKISACTITKNEEKNIARSIESYKKYVDEIIIVDTGSTDNTVKIAEDLGAKVIHFEWINDFSAAKNCAIDAATGDWILFLDADEWIKDNGGEKLQTVIKNAVDNDFDAVSFRMLNLDDDETLIETTSSLRLFVNKPNIRYMRKIHEHLFDSENKKTLVSLRTDDMILNHSGYARSISKTKITRNNELLEKNYMEGFAEGIDYFYLARENLTLNPEYAQKFLDMLLNDEKNVNAIKNLDIANNIGDLKMNIITLMGNKYSVEERIKIIDDTIKEFPEDPSYYFLKYVQLVNRGEFDKLELVQKAIELDKVYESKIKGNNNSFSKYKVDALCELAQDAIRKNDNLKAMDYLVQAAMTGQQKEEMLKDLMYIIQPQNAEEKVKFLSSIFDISKENNLKFLVQALRTTKYNDIFLYFFVKYYKEFGEVDISLFTSLMINKSFEDAANKYLKVYLTSNDKKAEVLLVSAIILGELREFFDANKSNFSFCARKIVSSYLEDEVIEDINKEDEAFISNVMDEILYLVSEDTLNKIARIFDYNENVLKSIVRIYYKDRNYKELLAFTNIFIERDLSDEFAGEITAKLGECFSQMNDFNNAQLYYTQAIEVGFLDPTLVKNFDVLKQKVQLDEVTLNKFEKYKELVSKFVRAYNSFKCEKIEDEDIAEMSLSIKQFEEDILNKVNITESFKSDLFKYATKLFDMKVFVLAEKYYKLLLKAEYNIGKCYYNLGKIYNQYGAAELSYLCYDRAFKTAINFPATILPENHSNKRYLYKKHKEKTNDKCPICGVEGKVEKCYQYLESKDLLEESAVVVKYRLCDKCSHIFAENYIENEEYNSCENINEQLFNIFDIKEKLEKSDKLVVVNESDEIYRTLLDDFDVEYVKGSFEKDIDIKALLEKIGERNLITVINNKDSVLNENADMPLWAKVGIVNVYSKKSIKKLLENNGYTDIKIYDSKFIPGKMTIIAHK